MSLPGYRALSGPGPTATIPAKALEATIHLSHPPKIGLKPVVKPPHCIVCKYEPRCKPHSSPFTPIYRVRQIDRFFPALMFGHEYICSS
jgi:hypothetical protein